MSTNTDTTEKLLEKVEFLEVGESRKGSDGPVSPVKRHHQCG